MARAIPDGAVGAVLVELIVIVNMTKPEMTEINENILIIRPIDFPIKVMIIPSSRDCQVMRELITWVILKGMLR